MAAETIILPRYSNSEDFIILGDQKADMTADLPSGDQGIATEASLTRDERHKHVASPHPIIIREVQVTKVKQCTCEETFLEKIWITFLTMNLFIIPALIGIILSYMMTSSYFVFESVYEEAQQQFVLGLLGASIVIGLPFHILAMAELEEEMHKTKSSMDVTSVGTQTDNHDTVEEETEAEGPTDTYYENGH